MIRKYIQMGLIVLFFISACSKPLEDVYSTELKFPEFINVEVLNAMNVTIEYGEEQKVIVTGNESAIKEVVTEVISETLIIDIENKIEYQADNIESLSYTIITPFIREVKNASTSDIEIKDFEQNGYLSLIISNSGNIELGKFNFVNLLNIAIESEGSVFGRKPFESLKDLNVKISGKGAYDAFIIEAENVIAEIDGSGSCSVYAKEELNVIINGVGIVYYKGYPVINESIYGNGSIIDAN